MVLSIFTTIQCAILLSFIIKTHSFSNIQKLKGFNINDYYSKTVVFMSAGSSTMEKIVSAPSKTEEAMIALTDEMKARSNEAEPFIDSELSNIIKSLQNLTPENSNIEWRSLRQLLSKVGHYSHKDWDRTENNSVLLGKLLISKDSMSSPSTRQLFDRIINEGNWDGAVRHAIEAHGEKQGQCKPWAVLVTGVNGIRKTTAMYQSWFPIVLEEALVAPPDEKFVYSQEMLPCGENSFFRQLDHMITTLCNEDFKRLYALAGADIKTKEENHSISKNLIQKYSNLKAAIFTRFRTLSELLGVVLLREAQKVNINCMLETSGRDVAMFHYVDKFFPKKRYKKMALHFVINDLTYAQTSVDNRMVQEMKAGFDALRSNDANKIVYANAGGPYGSEVLKGVQIDSDRVWKENVMKGNVGQDWYKATIAINAHPTEPWTAQAIRPDGSTGTMYTFAPPRVVN